MAREPMKPGIRDADWPLLHGYQIEAVLGRGATGTVYRARQDPVGREVAIKVLHLEFSGRSRVVQRLQREARTTARLAHPHLVSAVDMGETNGRWWYAMEFVDGPSMALRLREEGPMSEREALRLFIPLCEALEHLWEHGVVHRDIKPANILIDRAGGARLADLGLAFADDDEELTKQGGTLGTPAYISPEQAVDPRDADVRSDIWSFGATLFHAVCGRSPFRAESAAEVLSRVLYGRIPHPQELEPRVSRGLSLVLRKCLSRDREMRYQTPTELIADLERIRERRPPKVRRGQLDPVQSAHDPRSTWSVVGVIAVLVIAAAIWAASSLSPGARPEEEAALSSLDPYPPLEDLANRAGGETARLAEWFGELGELARDLPDPHRARWMSLMRELREALRDEVRALREEITPRIEGALAGNDHGEAWRLREEVFATSLLERTGFRVEGLEAELPSITPWLDQVSSQVESAEAISLDRLRTALETLRDRVFERVDRLLLRQEWSLAREELLASDEQLLAGAGFGDYRFRPESLDAVLAPVRIGFGLRRQNLDDAWLFLDQELRREVVARSERLRGELEEGGRYFPASVELREKFERVLHDRRLTREKIPEGLPHAALDALEERAAELVLLEDRLLEEDARRAFEDAERRSERLWSERGYEAIGGLWEEVALRLELPGGVLDAEWRRELTRRAALRREEALLLRGLLERAAHRIVEHDGRTIELRVRGILYTDRRVVAGLDPLTDGFALEGIVERLDLHSLATSELERLVGRGEGEDLPSEELLAIALLRHRDGQFEEARSAVNAWDLPGGDDPRSLATDLRVRVTDAVLELERRRGFRAPEAARLLALVADPIRIEQESRRVLVWVEELLDRYEDVPEVRERRSELLALRDRLRKRSRRPGKADYLAAFGPSRIEFTGGNHVRMDFDFQAEEVGSWRRGDWVFDNLGWILNARVDDLDDLPRQRGLRLIVEDPLDVDAGIFDLTLRVEQPIESGPHRLLVISAVGFHAAIVGPRFGGDPGGARVLAETGTLEELLAAIRRGEGMRTETALTTDQPHEITLHLNRRSGRLEILLDGREIARRYPSRPDPDARSITIRSWDRTRILGATLTARR
jgi:serine/threonine protein kinase